MRYLSSNVVSSKPFNFAGIKGFAKLEWDADFSEPEKIVIIGNRCYEDIILGRLNGMASIYVTKLN